MLVILDLDETLIHATSKKLEIQEDFIFDKYYIYLRPNLQKFLSELANEFKLGIWSSASDHYVEQVVNLIKPPELSFEIVWGRSRCSLRRDIDLDTHVYEKRLDKLKKKGFTLDQIIIVDDTQEKSRTNYGNSIKIKEFIGQQNDEELNHLLNYIKTLKTIPNVRTVEKRYWREKGST